MAVRVAEWISLGVAVYAAAGLVFALLFVVAGVNRVDPVAARSGWGFRLMILPGSAALWPLMLSRWLRSSTPPAESNAHRRAARRVR